MSALIIPFPTRRVQRRLGAQDRIEAMEWGMDAKPFGVTRLAICDQTDPEIGDFVLIYEHDRAWASWGVSRGGAGFCAWRADGPDIIGRFPSIRAALDAVIAMPAEHGRSPAG